MDSQQATAWLSEPRFRPFKDAANGDHDAAVALYIWHADLATACFGVVQHFEVILRNAIDRTLGDGQPQEPLKDTWLMDFDTLQPGGIKQVITAVERLERGTQITRARVVAGVPFGFWAGLFGRPYDELWREHLHKAFPDGSGRRKDLPPRMLRIRRFRNRLAHHDSILGQDVNSTYEDMLTIAGWIDAAARHWLEEHSSVPTVITRRP
jgi:hypothetical protein